MTEEQIKELAKRHGIWIPMGSEEAQAVAGLGTLIAEVCRPAPEAQPAAASTATLTKNGAEAWKDVPREGDWVADAGEVG